MLKRTDRWIIYTVWLVTQAALLAAFGINGRSDAQKYIQLSREIVGGQWDVGWNDLFYSGYVAIHVLLRLLGLPAKTMYAVQLVLSAVGLHYFLRTLALWVRSRPALLISGILYASCWVTQQWVPVLLTDTVFFDLLTIGVYYLLSAPAGGRTAWVFILILPFFRPTGVLFVVFAGFYWLFTARQSRKLLPLAGVLVLLAGWVYLALTGGRDYFYPYHNLQANIICGLPSGLQAYQRTPYRGGMSVIGYLWANPGMSIRLFAARLVEVFAMTRPYFSSLHNLAAKGFECVYYLLASVGVAGLLREKRQVIRYLAAGMVIFCAPSVLFCADWSGRFSLPVFCFLLLLVGSGVDVLWRRMPPRNNILGKKRSENF
ncbi:MAG TPA: hypothetical protein VHE54_05540 [Puia sp.]|nr:hypothetical protein [Puia sp.]